MAEKTIRLPDSELEVMRVLWDCEAPVARATVEAEMEKVRPLAQTTLLTLLSRLAEKGFVRIEKQGRSSFYTPLMAREDYQARQSKRCLDQVFGGFFVLAKVEPELGACHHEVGIDGALRVGRLDKAVQAFACNFERLGTPRLRKGENVP